MTMATDSDGRPETCAHIAAGSLFSRFVVFFFRFPSKYQVQVAVGWVV